MNKLLKALRPAPKAALYCDGRATRTLADCVRSRTGDLRFDPPGGGRVA